MAGELPPDAQALWDELTATDKRRIGAWNKSPDLTRQGLPSRADPVINPFDYAESAEATGIKSPFAAIPTAASKAEFSTPAYEMIGFFGENLDDVNAPAMFDYSFDDSGFGFQNLAEEPRVDEEPAPITLTPTSTTNPDRPRTVAAGYDSKQKKLTVIFRDGTYYNYFDVDYETWRSFKRVRSKGRFILQYLDGHSRGIADVSTIPSYARETAHRFIRTGQSFRGGYQAGHGKKGGAYFKPGETRKPRTPRTP